MHLKTPIISHSNSRKVPHQIHACRAAAKNFKIKLQCISCCIEIARRRAHPNPAPQYSDTFQNMPIPEFTRSHENQCSTTFNACLMPKKMFGTTCTKLCCSSAHTQQVLSEASGDHNATTLTISKLHKKLPCRTKAALRIDAQSTKSKSKLPIAILKILFYFILLYF